MKGKTIAIGLIVVTVLVVAAVYFLVMATFKHDEEKSGTSMGVTVAEQAAAGLEIPLR
ncbi:hypothetical protein NCCP2716_08460 [Sporosarcina sp. NCCP-2716]|uniref:hypothetical protein n=1 Tax=Sporosarcina sp. NCCP-2716 TaxID=2943679 RepID=UPI0020400FAD|nr:hypothetical protein [Sporosarcina sp. NCCP-2716]GKV68348.1 hypothetical protein NCCP2716_08460 [Sporosarcina sp. NCCP-2716]